MNHVCVIAEAGVNHNGNIEIAKKMIDVAKEAGADYVKFQTFIPEKLVSKYAEKAEYQKKNTDSGESQLQMLKKLALTYMDFTDLKKYCEQVGIGFISTPFDLDSINFLNTLDMDFWKIPSGEITNLPYLEAIAKTGRKIIMSTGMSDMKEINEAVAVLEKFGSRDIVLLHCNTQYPTPYEDVNLNVMITIKNATGKMVGYSDHTQGIEIPIAAVAMGAHVIEKHFTLDKCMDGPDHKASLNPIELKEMVSAIRHIEKALGNGEKTITFSESVNRDVVRKSIVAKRDIKQGETLSWDNMTVKRPGNGISPMKWYELLGTKSNKMYKEDEQITL